MLQLLLLRRKVSLAVTIVGVFLTFKLHTFQQELQSQNVFMKACTSTQYRSMDHFVNATGYLPYSRTFGMLLFDAKLCHATQMVHYFQQQSSPLGVILQWNQALLHAPIFLLTTLEGGRQGMEGNPLSYTTIWMWCYYLFGTATVFLGLWIPCYWVHYGGIEHSEPVSMHPQRARFGGLLAVLPLMLLSVLVLGVLDISWKTTIGFWASPILPVFFPVLCWLWKPPLVVSSKEAIATAKSVALSYAIVGGLCLLQWWYLLYVYFRHYGNNFVQFWKDLSITRSHPTGLTGELSLLHGLALEVMGLCAGLFLFVASRSGFSALEAALFMPFLGPSAACAMELATLELERFSVPDKQTIKKRSTAITNSGINKRKQKSN